MIRTTVTSLNILHEGWNPLLVPQGLACLHLSVDFPPIVCFTSLKGLNSAEVRDEEGRYRKSQGQEGRCGNGTGPTRTGSE